MVGTYIHIIGENVRDGCRNSLTLRRPTCRYRCKLSDDIAQFPDGKVVILLREISVNCVVMHIIDVGQQAHRPGC